MEIHPVQSHHLSIHPKMVFYAQAQSRRLDYLDYSDSDSNHHNPGYAERGYCGGFKTGPQRHTWGNHSNQDSLPWYRGHQLGIMVPTWFITLTIFVQWIRCWRVTRDGGRDWDLRGLHTRRPSLQLALGTRFITWPFLSLNFLLSSILAEISSWWKGVYGSGEPLVIPFNDVPDILAPFLKVFIPRSFPFIRAIFLITMMMAIQIFFDDQSW